MSDFWNVRQTARRLGLSTRSVYRLVEQGELVAVKFAARSVRISVASVTDLIQRRLAEARRERGLEEETEGRPPPDSRERKRTR